MSRFEGRWAIKVRMKHSGEVLEIGTDWRSFRNLLLQLPGEAFEICKKAFEPYKPIRFIPLSARLEALANFQKRGWVEIIEREWPYLVEERCRAVK